MWKENKRKQVRRDASKKRGKRRARKEERSGEGRRREVNR
jgi:hypothetical protein